MLYVVGREKMDSGVTDRSLTQCWQHDGAFLSSAIKRKHLIRNRFEEEDELHFEHLESEGPVGDRGMGIQQTAGDKCTEPKLKGDFYYRNK